MAFAYIYNKQYTESLTMLDRAFAYDEKDENLIMGYIYAYSLINKYPDAKAWTNKGKLYLRDKIHIKELNFWIKYIQIINKSPERLIHSTESMVMYFKKKCIYSKYVFYINIMILLLEKCGRYEEAYKELKYVTEFIFCLKNS